MASQLEAPGLSTGFLIVNADDWGRDRLTTDRTLECTQSGAVSSVSAMVFMEDSERAAAIAKERGIETGLHLNLTTTFSGANCPPRLIERQQKLAGYLQRHRLSQVVFHPGLVRSFEFVVAAQLDEFRRLYGSEPDRIDGHHHMHLCANVLFAGLLPSGTLVRRNFSFQPGEKSLGNVLYRRIVDRMLARRHRLVDFFFSLPPLEPSRLERMCSLAQRFVVEVETHPVNPEEYRFLTEGRLFGPYTSSATRQSRRIEVKKAMDPIHHGMKSPEAGPIQSHAATMSTDRADIQVKGKPVRVESAQIDGRTVVVTGKWLRIAAIQDEELVEGEPVPEPSSFVSQLTGKGLNADIFTFAQKLPDTVPKHAYHLEWDNPAVIPITTFAEWWEKRVESSVRRAVRKGAKLGVVTKVAQFDDAFVDGIVEIYNETPIRQGRTFWHYQKDVDTVRRENSTYFERSTYLGVYFQDALIGFLRMISVDKIATIVQVISKMKHYDKRPTNALIAKAVEICEQKGVSHLVYCYYIYNDPNSSLTEFKRRNGFEQVLLPRYYVPLTLKGRIALRFKLHRKLAQHIPTPVLTQLRRVREWWNQRTEPAKETD